MSDKYSPFTDALVKAVQVDSLENIRNEVESRVIEKCTQRGFLTNEEQHNPSDRYQMVKEVFNNDYEALSLLKKESLKVAVSSDLRPFYDELDDMAEEIIESVARRLLQRQIKLPSF